MKKVFLSGRFDKSAHFFSDITNGEKCVLDKELKNDFRVKLLGDIERLLYPCDAVINHKYRYVGPFWFERDTDDTFTDKDYKTIVSEEMREISTCDIFIIVLSEGSISGSVCELCYALENKKEVYILYKIQESICEIKSEHWFVIADAIRRDKNVKIFSYENSEEILSIINNILV